MSAPLKILQDSLARKKTAGWMIRASRKKSSQLYMTKETVESERLAETSVYEITVFHHHDHQGRPALGSATFSLDESSLASFEQEFEKSWLAASLVHNEPYELPEASGYPEVLIHDPDIANSSAKLLADLRDRLRDSVAKEKGVRLSGAEFFLDHIETQLINHRGLSASQQETQINSEMILLAQGKEGESEFITRPSRRLLKDFDLKGEIRQAAEMARDRTQAGPPPTGTFDVVFAEEALDHLFNPFMAASSAGMKYNQMTTSQIGKPVLGIENPQGEKLTLWNNGLLPGALGTRRFDALGTPQGKQLLIDQNMLKSYWANKRYADYLKVPCTGDFANVEVACGAKTERELLRSGRVFQLVAFSVFEPNSLTGAFSAEIRMGYEVTPSGRRPVKGGSVAGVLGQAFRRVYFSQESIQRERYFGPKAILCQGLTLAGA